MFTNIQKTGTTSMSFDVVVARDLGLEEAVAHHSICFWCDLNRRNKSTKHYHEDKYWMYFSHREFAEYYGFWTESQVRRIFEKLLRNGYIEKGCFNKKGYDKTNWYTPLKWVDINVQNSSGTNEPSEIIDRPF